MGPSYIYVRPHIGSLQGDGEGGEKMEKQLFISSIPMLAVIRQPNRGGKIEAHTHIIHHLQGGWVLLQNTMHDFCNIKIYLQERILESTWKLITP